MQYRSCYGKNAMELFVEYKINKKSYELAHVFGDLWSLVMF